MMLPVPLEVTLRITEMLEKLGVPCFIGGSLASSIHGMVRATNDVDIVADLRAEHVQPLVDDLAEEFYADVSAIRVATQERSSFNVIHLPTMFKVDVFITPRSAFDRSQFARRESQTIATEPDRTAFVATREDTVLSKLHWYRKGGEVSERQWSDIVGVLKADPTLMDHEYLREWAATIGVSDLLERALIAATSEK